MAAAVYIDVARVFAWMLLVPLYTLFFGFGYATANVTGRAHRPKTKAAIAGPASALRNALGFGVLLSHVEKFCPAEPLNTTQQIGEVL